MDGQRQAHLADPADVLVPALLVEAEVVVEAEADVVAVESVGELLEVEEVLLERAADRGLAAGAEASEPDRRAALLQEADALLGGHGACGRVSGGIADRCDRCSPGWKVMLVAMGGSGRGGCWCWC